jgi:hypothetical protein
MPEERYDWNIVGSGFGGSVGFVSPTDVAHDHEPIVLSEALCRV